MTTQQEWIDDPDEFEELAWKLLSAALPAATTQAIDAALRAGLSGDQVVRAVAARAGKRRALLVVAVEEYLRRRHRWFGPPLRDNDEEEY